MENFYLALIYNSHKQLQFEIRQHKIRWELGFTLLITGYIIFLDTGDNYLRNSYNHSIWIHNRILLASYYKFANFKFRFPYQQIYGCIGCWIIVNISFYKWVWKHSCAKRCTSETKLIFIKFVSVLSNKIQCNICKMWIDCSLTQKFNATSLIWSIKIACLQ